MTELERFAHHLFAVESLYETILIVAAVVTISFILDSKWIANLSQWATNLFQRKIAPEKALRNSHLVKVLLGLPERSVEELLDLYKKEFGKGPARYARQTFRKWKAGQVRPATQTFERFLVHLPKVMSFDLKCEVLRRFMEEYAAKDHYELDVTTANWERKLGPLVRQIIDKAFTAQLPVEVERRLDWLGDGDMQAAQQILRNSQAEEGKIMVSMLRDEFAAIEDLFAEGHLNSRVSHVLEFPYGTITVNIKSNGRNG